MVWRNVFLTLVLIAFLGSSAWAQTVIWYLPHPDDETIGMADSIYQSVMAGNRNYFIYFTKGEGSLVGRRFKAPDGEVHELTREEFAQGRVRETLAALNVLGVEDHQVIFFDFPDGAIPLSAAVETMRYFSTLYPGSIHRTVSQHDPHEDHKTLARALAQVSSEDESMYPEYFHVYIHRNPVAMESVEKREVLYPEVKAAALAEFWCVDVANGRFGIASRSTPDLLKEALTSSYEYVDPPERMPPPRKQALGLGFQISTLDLGLYIPVYEQVSLIALYDYRAGGVLSEVKFKLNDDIPLVGINLGMGYHFVHKKPHLSASLNIGPYFIKLRHISQKDTRIGVGISTLLQKN